MSIVYIGARHDAAREPRDLAMMTRIMALSSACTALTASWQPVPPGAWEGSFFRGSSPPRSRPTAATDAAGNTWLFGGSAEPALSRRNLVRGALWAAGSRALALSSAASAYTINEVKPDERDLYYEAQNGKSGPKRILWIGSGNVTKGLIKDLFQAGNEVIALDLKRPKPRDYRAATTYATEHGFQFSFFQGDATRLKFDDASFDVVVSSQFLCQFDQIGGPKTVIEEIRRVLKPGGRFGFYEDEPEVDKVIVGKVFGESAVVRVDANPLKSNIIGGVVRKV